MLIEQITDVFDKLSTLAKEQQETMTLLANKYIALNERVIKLEQMPRKIVKEKDDYPEGYPYK